MTNEQREAIDRLRRGLDDIWFATLYSQEEMDKDIDKVLSLIKEQQEKIEKYEKIYKEYDCDKFVKEIEKKDKIIEKIQEELRDHIGFENRLKRENKEPDLFNQGRFYVANNINNILKTKET